MKAIVKKESKAGLWMQEVPIPKIGEKEVLIRVRKSAICGTDVNIYQWYPWSQKNVALGTVVGHEFLAEVAEVGNRVQTVRVGDRVSAESHIVCNRCRNCLQGMKHLCPETKVIGVHRDGCFAEYVSIPEENIFHVSSEIPDSVAAIFDPFGNATHTALSFDLDGEDVLIAGAGPSGVMACAIAKHAGARKIVITDVNPYRLTLAKKMGATHAIDVSQTNLKEALKNENVHFTVGMEMSGNPQGLNTLLEALEPGGNVGLLGILPPKTLIDWDLVIFKMLKIKGIFGREIFSTWYKMSNMLEAGLDLTPVITHHFPIDQFNQAFELMISGQSGKIVLDWI